MNAARTFSTFFNLSRIYILKMIYYLKRYTSRMIVWPASTGLKIELQGLFDIFNYKKMQLGKPYRVDLFQFIMSQVHPIPPTCSQKKIVTHPTSSLYVTAWYHLYLLYATSLHPAICRFILQILCGILLRRTLNYINP